MSDQISDKRKEEVARWLGFEFVIAHDNYWLSPDGFTFYILPDFPNDIAACFKWIVPKLIEAKWSFTLRWSGFPPGKPSCSCSYWGGTDNKQERPHIQKVSEPPSMAIFLAAEQVMKVEAKV